VFNFAINPTLPIAKARCDAMSRSFLVGIAAAESTSRVQTRAARPPARIHQYRKSELDQRWATIPV
jgi:hypothetical protein